MKFYLAITLSLASGALATGSSGCNANNCARGVTGTRVGKKPDLTSRFEDCESFMMTTVTPATFTKTETTTVYTDSPPVARREVEQRNAPGTAVTSIPTSVPEYASSCNGPEGFSSACSCWGATATVTSLPTPTTTAVVTSYVNTGCKLPLSCPVPFINQWPCGGKWCACLLAADGQKACVEDNNCFAAKACSKNSDCKTGEGCVVNSCCAVLGKGKICLKYAPAKCPNFFSPRDIFKTRDEEATEEPTIGCSAFGCPDGEIIEDQMRR
ncbi:hypothetical protein F5X68DRAFT_52919 [Plectosphaerella plurivora]|uniref:Uncharacterized protein n=1 Tax=Plectosphaerella plurivora TaxID=936078 RepID=A0A9P9A7D4_9PEZI|nr:hypothetical protein F5X68DRAFT_52919 [Plectosphaerella plurivora]